MQSGWLRASHRAARPSAPRPSSLPVPTYGPLTDAAPLPHGEVRARPRARCTRSATCSAPARRIRVAVQPPGGNRPRWAFACDQPDGAATNEVSPVAPATRRGWCCRWSPNPPVPETPLPRLRLPAGPAVPRVRARPRNSGGDAKDDRPMAGTTRVRCLRTGPLAEHYVERFAALDPLAATVRGHRRARPRDDRLLPRRHRGARRARPRRRCARSPPSALETTPTASPPRCCASTSTLALEAARRGRATCGTSACSAARSRVSAWLRPHAARDTRTTGQTIAERLALVPQGLDGIEVALHEGVRQGIVAARRQAVACAQQADTWGGVDATPAVLPSRSSTSTTRARHRRRPRSRPRSTRLADRGDRGLRVARPVPRRGVPAARDRARRGRARALRAATRATSTGMELDLDETYAWGWEELHRIEHAMQPGRRADPARRATSTTVIEHLEHDPDRVIEGVDEFQRWHQDLLDRTVAELDGAHFDIPEPVKRVEAMIAPPGGAAAMYYTGPSEDFTRPGRTWYPTLGHDAVPALGRGVDLLPRGRPRPSPPDRAGAVPRRTRLSRFQRTLAGTSGHARGLGALRRAPDGRARLPRRPRLRARDAARPGDARRAGRRRHRHAPRARRSRRASASTPARPWTPELGARRS